MTQTLAQKLKQAGFSYLGKVNSSSKLTKNDKVNNQYTYCIYLAPANESGYNVCAYSTPECRLGCLATSGRAKVELLSNISRIHDARVRKSRLFFENRDLFMSILHLEMLHYQRKAQKDNYGFSVRLNGTSDIDWANVYYGEENKNVFQYFPDVQFYDYTKDPSKVINTVPNYHLTFSYSGRNENVALVLLKKGFNIAVVFDVKKKQALPKTFKGYEVIDGDLSDFRPEDKKGVVLGLRFKSIADKSAELQIRNSVFVVKPEMISEEQIRINDLIESI